MPLDPKKSFEWLSIIIQRFLNKNGLSSSTGRISDILASNGGDFKKVSGTAQARRGSALLWHSTLMIETPVERIVRYLPIPPDRPGLKHEDYVTNLKNLNVKKSFESVKTEIMDISKDFFPFLRKNLLNDPLPSGEIVQTYNQIAVNISFADVTPAIPNNAKIAITIHPVIKKPKGLPI